MPEIKFYEPEDEYGFLSNFAPYSLQAKGKKWPTSEHYYQAQKYAGTDYEEKCRRASTPLIAFQMSRQAGAPIRNDWQKVKDSVMRDAVYFKFSQHPELAEMLLATGDATLIENSPVDSYWGCGRDDCGQNMLGKILMEVRQRLREGSK